MRAGRLSHGANEQLNGSQWDGNEYRPGDRATWNMT
jgi:hypothetical protein